MFIFSLWIQNGGVVSGSTLLCSYLSCGPSYLCKRPCIMRVLMWFQSLTRVMLYILLSSLCKLLSSDYKIVVTNFKVLCSLDGRRRQQRSFRRRYIAHLNNKMIIESVGVGKLRKQKRYCVILILSPYCLCLPQRETGVTIMM